MHAYLRTPVRECTDPPPGYPEPFCTDQADRALPPPTDTRPPAPTPTSTGPAHLIPAIRAASHALRGSCPVRVLYQALDGAMTWADLETAVFELVADGRVLPVYRGRRPALLLTVHEVDDLTEGVVYELFDERVVAIRPFGMEHNGRYWLLAGSAHHYIVLPDGSLLGAARWCGDAWHRGEVWPTDFTVTDLTPARGGAA